MNLDPLVWTTEVELRYSRCGMILKLSWLDKDINEEMLRRVGEAYGIC